MAKEREKKGGLEAPGTLVIALIFFLWFAVMYLISWISLTRVWGVG